MPPAVQHWLPKPVSQTILRVVRSILNQSLSLVEDANRSTMMRTLLLPTRQYCELHWTPRKCSFFIFIIILRLSIEIWILSYWNIYSYRLYGYYSIQKEVNRKRLVYYYSGFKLHDIQNHHFIFLSLTQTDCRGIKL